MGAPSRPEAAAGVFGPLAGALETIAETLEAGRGSTDVTAALHEAAARCQGRGDLPTDQQRLFQNVHTVVSTWREVWPRMGARREFRQAVAREARLWARRLRGG